MSVLGMSEQQVYFAERSRPASIACHTLGAGFPHAETLRSLVRG